MADDMDDKDRIGRAVAALQRHLSAYDIPRDVLASAARAAFDAAPRRPKTHARIDEFMDLVNQGLSYSEIGERMGIAKSTCARIAKENGVVRGGEWHRATPWTEEMTATLVGMSRAGLSAEIVAKRLGVSADLVLKKRVKLGIRMRGHKVIRKDGRVINMPVLNHGPR